MHNLIPLLFPLLHLHLTHAQWENLPASLLSAAPTTALPASASAADSASDYADSAPSGIFTVPSASSIEDLLPTSPPRDPCGPLIQPANLVGSTCNVSLLNSPTTPSPYGVQCIDPGYPDRPNISFAACMTETIPAICEQLVRPNVPKGTWVWASARAPDVCSMGFWLPTYEGSARPIRDFEECVRDVWTPMVGFCNPARSPGMYNLGLVNLRRVPDAEQSGSQVDAGYPSYVLATRELTAREAGG